MNYKIEDIDTKSIELKDLSNNILRLYEDAEQTRIRMDWEHKQIDRNTPEPHPSTPNNMFSKLMNLKLNKPEEKKIYKQDEVDDVDLLELKISGFTKSSKKKLRNLIHNAIKKKTQRSYNRAFAFIYKRDLAPKVMFCFGKKESEIQKKRRIWLDLRTQAEKALDDYKNEKGDFYKNRM